MRVSTIRRRRILHRPLKPASELQGSKVLCLSTAQFLSSRPKLPVGEVLFWTFRETKHRPLTIKDVSLVHGRFCYELKVARTENGFPKMHMLWAPRPAQSSDTPNPGYGTPVCSFLPTPLHTAGLISTMAAFVVTLTYTDEQKSAAPNLEQSFEHLLRSSSVHESILTTLRVNETTDRDTSCEHV